MATTILTLANAIGRDTGSCLVRDNAGIPYFVGLNGVLYEGNAVVPTGWTSRGTLGNGVIPVAMCMVTGTTIGMIAAVTAGMGANLSYAIFNCATNTIGTPTTIVAIDNLAASNSWDIAVDGNGDVHVVYRNYVSNMGTDYFTVHYTNNIGGTFKTPIAIYGAAQQVFCHDVSIFINTGNIPEIRFDTNGSPTYEEKIGVGNQTNATSFTIHDGSVDISNSSGRHVISTSLGDTITIGDVTSGRDVLFYKHRAGDAWSSWEVTIDDTYLNYGNGWAGVPYGDGTVFYIGDRDVTGDMVITQIDHSTTPGVTPSFSAPVQIQAENAARIITKRARYLNYGSDGVDHGVAATQKEIDYVYLVGSSLKFDSFTINKRPTIVPNTAEANNFGSDSTPTLEFTGTDDDGDDLEYEIHITDTLSTVCDEHPVSQANDFLTLTDGGIVFVGQSFTGNGEKIKQAKLYLRKQAGLTSTVGCQIYAHSGTFGTSSIASGNEIAHASVPASALTTSFTQITFDFVGDESITLVNGTKYVVMIASWALGGNIDVQSDTGQTLPHDGNASQYPTPTALPNEDLIFQILTEGTAIINKFSETPDAGFLNTVNGGDTHPFNESEKISYTVQAGDALDAGTYYWKARANDPLGTDLWSDWTTQRSFIIEGAAGSILGVINNVATTSGILTGKGSLSGAINGTVTVTVSSILKIDANINGVATVEGLLDAHVEGTGQSDGVATTSGLLTAKGNLVVSINGIATTISVLTAKGSLVGLIDMIGSAGPIVYQQTVQDISYPTLFGTGQRHGLSLISFNGSIGKVTFKLRDLYDSADFDFTCELWNVDSGNDYLPTTLIETSSTVHAASGMPDDPGQEYEFLFNGDSFNQSIAIVIYAYNINIGSDVRQYFASTEVDSNMRRIQQDVSPPTWFYLSDADIYVKIYGATQGINTLGTLIAQGSLLGTSNSSTTTTSVLTAKGDQDSTINNVTTTSGVLSGKGALAGASNGVTTTSSNLTNSVSIGALSGEINGVATIAGILTATGALIGASNPALTVSGVLQARGDLTGVSNGIATTSLTGPPILRQYDFRFYQNIDAIQPTTPNAVENRLISNIPVAGKVRIRVSIENTGGELSASSKSFKLQYGLSGTGVNHIAGSAISTWIDVGASGSGAIWRGFNNATPADNAQITSALLVNSTVLGSYEETGGTTANVNAVPNSGVIEYDFVIERNGAPAGTYYCFRIVETNGTVLNSYVNYPKLATINVPANHEQHQWCVVNDSETNVSGEDQTTFDVINGSTYRLRLMHKDGGNFISGGLVRLWYYKTWADFSGNTNGVLIPQPGAATTEDWEMWDDGNTNWWSHGSSPTIVATNDHNPEIGRSLEKQILLGDSFLLDWTAVGSNAGPEHNFSLKFVGSATPVKVYYIRIELDGTIISYSNMHYGSNKPVFFSTEASSPGAILAVITNVATVSGTLIDGNNPITSTVNSIATTSGTLIGKIALDVFINGVTTITGILTANGSLAVVSDGVAAVQGELLGKSMISSTVNGLATISGILTAKGTLSGQSDGSTTLSGVVGSFAFIDSTINGVATITGILTAKGDADSAINNIATTSGVLTASASLVGTINGVATTTSVLTALGTLSGSSDGVATIDSFLASNLMLGTSNGIATTSGSLTAIGSLASASNGVSTTSGALTSSAPLESSINGTTTITATLSAKGDFDSAINTISTVTGTLSATGSLAGTINGQTTTTSVLTLIGNLSGTINGVSTTSGVLTALGSLIGIINGVATTTSILTATGSLSGTVNGLVTVSGTINSNALIDSSINANATTSGTLTAKGDFDSAINNITTVSGTLSGIGNLVGAINGVSTTTGVLTPIGVLQSSINANSTASGALTGLGSLVGTVNGLTTISGVLTAYGSLSGSSNGIATVQGDIITEALNGTSNGVTTVQGILTANGQLVGTSNGVATTTSILIAKGDTDSVINSISTTSGTLTGTGVLSGVSNGLTTTVSVLSGLGSLSGTINGIATLNGTILTDGELLGQSNGSVIVSGTLSAKGQLESASNGVATIVVVLTAKGDTDSAINSIATVTGVLTSLGPLSGASDGIASTTSVLSGIGALEGIINGIATVDGTTASGGPIDSAINNLTTVTGVLSGNGSLISVINGVASTVGFMALTALEGSSDGLAAVSGTLNGLGSLVGTSNGTTTITGVTGAKNPIDTAIDGIATVTATLMGWGYILGVSSPLPDEYVWGTGNLFEAFEVANESIGQTIAISNKAVQWFEFEFDKIGSPDFEIRGEIWSLDGGGLPLSLLQVSLNTIQATSVTGTRTNYRWDFNQVGINYNGDYALVAHIINHTVGDGSNYIRKYYDDNNPFTDGYELRNPIGVAWSAELNNDLNGRVRLKRGVSGNLVGTSYGISNGFAIVSGTLSGDGALVGTINGTSTASLGLFFMEGQSNGVATTQGTLSGVGSLAGTVSGQATVDGSLISDALVGVANGTTTTQGTLSAKGSLVGVINANSTATGTLTYEGLLIGVSNGTATVSASLTAKGALVGSSNGSSSATVIVVELMYGEIGAGGSAEGTLTGRGNLEGIIDGSSEAILEYNAPSFMYGVIYADSTVTGTLTNIPDIDVNTMCFNVVRYIEKGPYLVNYRCEGKKHRFINNKICIK